MSYKILLVGSLVLLAIGMSIAVVDAQRPPPGGRRAPAALAGTGFTYQGQLKSGGALVNGSCDLAFRLYDDASAGTLVGSPITQTIPVTTGLFTTQLDFGANAFTGDSRWLDLQVRCPTGVGGFTALSPRQALTPAPYALALPGLFTQQNVTSTNIIGGFNGNTVDGGLFGATIGGGGQSGFINHISAPFGTIGGGITNTVNGYATTIGGGYSNTASNNYATIGGGLFNTASGSAATIGGGQNNTASGSAATIGGGYFNTASNYYATVGGGAYNTASGPGATVGGGYGNNVPITGTFATIGGGLFNSASGNYATIPGGYLNTAAGNNSFAAGYYALAQHNGTFVFSDISCYFFCLNPIPFTSTVANEFAVRSTGGARFVSAVNFFGTPTAGVQLAAGGGSWSSLSDRNVKANFETINPREVVAHVVALPIQTWNYQSQDASIRHIGPMAQDFYTAFKVGEDDTHITSVDAEGVAFAAIQGLHQIVQEQNAKIITLESDNAALETRVAALEQGMRANSKAVRREHANALALPNDWHIPVVLLVGAMGLFTFQRARRVRKQ